MPPRTYTAHQLTQLRLSLEEQHANELKELRLSYEAEKASLGDELAMVAEAIRREVNHDSAERDHSTRPERPVSVAIAPGSGYDDRASSAEEHAYMERQREADIQRRREELLLSLNEAAGPRGPPPEASSPSSAGAGRDADSSSTASSEELHPAPPAVEEETQTGSGGSSKASVKAKKNVRVEVLTKQLTDTTRQLSMLQRSYETAQQQIVELEQLLESQRAAFQHRAAQSSPREAPQRGAPRSPTAESGSQTEAALDAESPLELPGPAKSMPTVDSLADEMRRRLKALHARHYSWMQALETASYLQAGSERGASVGSVADAAMVADRKSVV